MGRITELKQEIEKLKVRADLLAILTRALLRGVKPDLHEERRAVNRWGEILEAKASVYVIKGSHGGILALELDGGSGHLICALDDFLIRYQGVANVDSDSHDAVMRDLAFSLVRQRAEALGLSQGKLECVEPARI